MGGEELGEIALNLIQVGSLEAAWLRSTDHMAIPAGSGHVVDIDALLRKAFEYGYVNAVRDFYLEATGEQLPGG